MQLFFILLFLKIAYPSDNVEIKPFNIGSTSPEVVIFDENYNPVYIEDDSASEESKQDIRNDEYINDCKTIENIFDEDQFHF